MEDTTGNGGSSNPRKPASDFNPNGSAADFIKFAKDRGMPLS